MNNQNLRIISLIPSATEIIHSLGCIDQLVGISHECDYPPEVRSRSVCTAPNLNPYGCSQEIHDRVSQLLQQALSVYRIDLEIISHLRPTHILTQAQCEACAVSLREVEVAVQQLQGCSPQLISLQPNCLEDVWQDMHAVGKALNVPAEPIVQKLQYQCQELVQSKALHAQSQRVACIEWTEPLMTAGNWVPELVTMAGGIPLLSQVGQHSDWTTWEDLQSAKPDVIVVMPCGFDLTATRTAIQELSVHPLWSTLPAVKHGAVYITDGNQYFNRPGPRLVDSLRILVEILGADQTHGKGWERYK